MLPVIRPAGFSTLLLFKLAPVADIGHYDIIIIGGGAAGFFGAVNAARLAPGKRVAILEKSSKLLAKVRVSGGGRCNVTHACFDNRELVKFYPRGGKELMGAFSRFNPKDTIGWFESRGVELKTESDGRMFPVTDNSETIIRCLLDEAEKYGVEIKLQAEVESIRKIGGRFLLGMQGGGQFTCEKLLIAAGGHPKAAAYRFISEMDHTIVEPVPSLFTFNMPADPVRGLMGVSVPRAKVQVDQTRIATEGPLLITHWGMSGPAVLKASAWGARELAKLNYTFKAVVSWVPDSANEESVRETLQMTRDYSASKHVENESPFNHPKRLWQFLVHKAGISSTQRWADLSKKQLASLAQVLFRDVYAVSGKTTFKEEFVTCGGVALNEVDFKTMESKKVPGLYFAGEVLDIDGVTGGFNFQSAWTAGWIAANAMVAGQ